MLLVKILIQRKKELRHCCSFFPRSFFIRTASQTTHTNRRPNPLCNGSHTKPAVHPMPPTANALSHQENAPTDAPLGHTAAFRSAQRVRFSRQVSGSCAAARSPGPLDHPEGPPSQAGRCGVCAARFAWKWYRSSVTPRRSAPFTPLSQSTRARDVTHREAGFYLVRREVRCGDGALIQCEVLPLRTSSHLKL